MCPRWLSADVRLQVKDRRLNPDDMETPKFETILVFALEKGVEIKLENTSFFLGREKLILGEKPKMGKWRSSLFLFLSKNSMDASSFFGIPSNQVIEIGVQFEL